MRYKFDLGKSKIQDTNPELEVLRIKLLKDTEKLVQKKFKLSNNFLLSDILISIIKKDKDPIFGKVINLDVVYGKYNLKDEKSIIQFINHEINKNIKILKQKNKLLKNKKYIIKKKNKHNIFILKYNNYEINVDKKTYYRIKSIITDNSFKIHMTYDMILWILFYRYRELYLYNNCQGAIHPNDYNKLTINFDVNLECFGSFFNHTLTNYFGLFPDLEQYFGCLGNFFNSKLVEGFYVINPPYTINAMNMTFRHVLKQFKNTKSDLSILLMIPTWVNDNRIKLNKVCNSQLKITTYKNEKELEIKSLIDSKLIKQYLLYCKNNFKHYDYIKEQDTYFSATTLILLSNNNIQYNIKNIFGKPNIDLNTYL
jgi:hypothetical protein